MSIIRDKAAEVNSRRGVEKTTGNSAAISDRNRNKSKSTAATKFPIPNSVRIGLTVIALRGSRNEARMTRFRNELNALHEKERLDHSLQVGGGRNDNAFENRFNAIMRSFEEKDLQKRIAKCEKRKKHSQQIGKFITDVIQRTGQQATIQSRKEALADLRGASDGLSRDDVVARYNAIDDTSFELG